MTAEAPEIGFGIGTTANGAPVVVIDDQVLPVSDIVARHGSPGPDTPLQMRDFMPDWVRWHEWLRGLDLRPAADDGWRRLNSVKFASPVPEPWNIFQTYHNFHRPSRIRGRLDPPKEERILPDIFFGSRSALAGYGDTIYREHGSTKFDFEVEVTAVIGRNAYRVSADEAEEYIAGYAIANDLTSHNAWWREIRRQSVINDNIRMKNFPGYTPMSRVIVPRDLVGDPRALRVRAWVDDWLRQDTRTDAMLWSAGELIEYLSWVMPLKPGDLILMGSPEELPVPPDREYNGIQPGQTVRIEVEKLGRLENRIEAQAERQPYEP